jgi:hypothetical protein
VQLQFTPVPLDQFRERIGVAGLCPGDEISFDENAPGRESNSTCFAVGIDAVARQNRALPAHFLSRPASTCSTEGA